MLKFVLLGIITVVLCFLVSPVVGFTVLAAAIVFALYSFVPGYYAVRGNREFEAGNDEQALEWYKKAVGTGRASIQIRISYSFILLRTGHLDESESELNAILTDRRVPADKRNMAKHTRCMVYYKSGRLDEAVEDAEELFEEYRNSSVYGMLGYFKLLKNEDLQETLDFCLEAYEYNSDDRDIMDNLSIVYCRLGMYEEAEEISEKLIESAPKFIEAYYHGAQIAYKQGHIKKALDLLDGIEDCKRTYLTTVSEEEIENFRKELTEKK